MRTHRPLFFLFLALPLISPTLCLAAPAESTALTLPELLQEIQEARTSLKALSFDFEQSSRSQERVTERRRGRILWLRPGRIRVDQRAPEKQSLVTDGDTFRLYQPEAKQVLTGSWKAWLATSGFPEPLIEMGGETPLEAWSDRYTIVFGGYDQHRYKLTFKPRNGSAPFVVWYSDESFLPVKGRLLRPDGRSDVDVSHLEVKPSIPEEAFRLRIPAGTAEVPIS